MSRQVSHIPTNSSHVALPGSGLSGVDIRPVAQILPTCQARD